MHHRNGILYLAIVLCLIGLATVTKAGYSRSVGHIGEPWVRNSICWIMRDIPSACISLALGDPLWLAVPGLLIMVIAQFFVEEVIQSYVCSPNGYTLREVKTYQTTHLAAFLFLLYAPTSWALFQVQKG